MGESPYPLASRGVNPDGTVVRVGGVEIGHGTLVVMAGCRGAARAGEIHDLVSRIAAAGAALLRVGAYTASPYAPQRVEVDELRCWRLATDRHGLQLICDATDVRQLPLLAEHADMLHVDAPHMQDFNLLKAVGRQPRPVLLKRGQSATLEEWLLGAEYIMVNGNHRVVLCETGIRTFESPTRHVMDIAAIPALKLLTHLPVLADPSAGTGRHELVLPMACAALAAGADGLLLDVHGDGATMRPHAGGSIPVDRLADVVTHLTSMAALSVRDPSTRGVPSAGPDCPQESTAGARRTPRAWVPSFGVGP